MTAATPTETRTSRSSAGPDSTSRALQQNERAHRTNEHTAAVGWCPTAAAVLMVNTGITPGALATSFLNTFKTMYRAGMDTRAGDHEAPASKAMQTRSLLADTALRLFREQGYDATTMRAIAREAGVSTGNAYYHFDGKESFVQELYRRVQEEHRDRSRSALSTGADLADNLRRTMMEGIDAMTPYHSFGATLLTTALSTESRTSPFSTASRAPREQAIGLMRDVVDSSARMPGGLVGKRLPELLWLAYMGVTLFWALDRSAQQRRTALLVTGLAPLVGRIVALTRLPVGRGIAREAIALLDRLHADGEHQEDPRQHGRRHTTGHTDRTGGTEEQGAEE